LLLVLFVAVNLFAHSVFAQSSVWKVSKGGSYFYLGGTIHMLKADDYPLPDEFTTAYNDADKIIFETDLVEAATPEYQFKMRQSMTYNDGRTLHSELTPETYAQLESFLTARGMAVANFSTFQPWGVALVLSMIEYQQLGMTGEFGVDFHFHDRALQDKKTVSSLETPDEQLIALSSMAQIEPNQVIALSLRDIESLPDFIDSVKNAWRSGDLDALSKNPLVVQMKVETPAMYQAMLIDRNNNWMNALPLLTNSESIEFVMVGAMHLVGEDGLLYLLKQQGFKVEQI
jgi:uncharacterized protein YbaP (TraB family)